MPILKYTCTHCNRKFESEEKEILECPGCFWTSSVKRADDAQTPVLAPADQKKNSKSFSFPAVPWKGIALAIVLSIGILLAIKLLPGVLRKTSSQVTALKEKTLKILPSKERSSTLGSEKQRKPGSVASESVRPEIAALPQEEQNILNRRVQISANRNLSEEEQKILNNRAVFKSGFSEKLPSQAWTLDNFKEMISQQEKYYQVPLPKSYKKKLFELFQVKYVPGAEAFANGNLMQARDEWVGSLAFPVYANNPQKHRGVVLTMLRPFITDTLSKIGSINSASVEKGIREKEQAVAEAYEKLFPLMVQKSWAEAVAAISHVTEKMDAFAAPDKVVQSPPPYPKDLALVDADIQLTLKELLTVPPPALSDLEPMQVDLARKKRVIEGFMPETLQSRQQKYDEGMDALKRGDWVEAEKDFKGIDLPFELTQDALEKIKVIRKLARQQEATPASMTSN